MQPFQENTIFIDGPGSTTIVINENPSTASSNSSSSGQDTELVQTESTEGCDDSHLEPTTSTSIADFPTDIAAGPDQPPVQPKITFPTTLKGNKYRSFNLEWYKQ